MSESFAFDAEAWTNDKTNKIQQQFHDLSISQKIEIRRRFDIAVAITLRARLLIKNIDEQNVLLKKIKKERKIYLISMTALFWALVVFYGNGSYVDWHVGWWIALGLMAVMLFSISSEIKESKEVIKRLNFELNSVVFKWNSNVPGYPLREYLNKIVDCQYDEERTTSLSQHTLALKENIVSKIAFEYYL